MQSKQKWWSQDNLTMILWRPSKGYQKENCKPLVKHKEIDMDKIQKQEHNDISKDLVYSLMKGMFLFLHSLGQKSSLLSPHDHSSYSRMISSPNNILSARIQ